MGLYIEVQDKEQWLNENGTPITASTFTAESIKNNDFLVCLIDNGPFMAAGVAYDEHELKYILNENTDPRPRKYFEVSKDLLKDVCPSWDSYVG